MIYGLVVVDLDTKEKVLIKTFWYKPEKKDIEIQISKYMSETYRLIIERSNGLIVHIGALNPNDQRTCIYRMVEIK